MITTISIHPNIFDIASYNMQEKSIYLNQLYTWCKFCRPKNSIVILDKQNILEKEIHNYIKNEKQIELKKQLVAIWQYINTNISRSKLSPKEFFINDSCQIYFRLVYKCQPEIVLVQDKICNNKHCKECFHEFINNDLNIEYPNKSDSWTEIKLNYSDIPEKYDFNSFISYTKLKKLIRYCDNFTLYDKNIIPESTNIISENYKYNLNNFIKLFKGYNVNFNIITYVKKTQIQQAEENIKKTIDIIENIAKSNNLTIGIKVLIGENENNQYMEQIHNRYIFTNLFNYSIDRGFDIINKTNGLNRSFDINIIDNEKAKLFQDYLLGLKQYNIN